MVVHAWAKRQEEDVLTIVVNERSGTNVSTELLDRLRAIPPATLGHMQDFNFMTPALRPIGRRNFIVCGPALTVKAMAIDSVVVHNAIDMAEPGDIIVIDRNGDNKHAAWGEMTSLAAQVAGVAATVIDGPATDVVEIEHMGYLVFSRGISPITTKSPGISGEINTTIQCGGVSVSPGDIILADDNGVVVIPPDQVADVVERCEPRARREVEMRRRLLAGEKISDLFGAGQKLTDALERQRSS
jgi:4-hydroxy-4-methyl-2-oxoglutarate aldolase